ncbi:MAG: hypothetical protein NC218_10500 [Acetobacter sp.]|nr:hypothetical protein [Acetobacter sp.]
MFLLICHRSERSEVKRSRESMDCHVANAPRNDGVLGVGDPLTNGVAIRGMTEKRGRSLDGLRGKPRDDGGRCDCVTGLWIGGSATGITLAAVWGLFFYGLPRRFTSRNDGLRCGVGDPLTHGAGAGHPERDDTEKRGIP